MANTGRRGNASAHRSPEVEERDRVVKKKRKMKKDSLYAALDVAGGLPLGAGRWPANSDAATAPPHASFTN